MKTGSFERQDLMMIIDFNKESYKAVQVAASVDNDVLRVAKNQRQMDFDINTYVKFDDIDFHNGVIEMDFMAELLPDAPDFARGFIGIVFRANDTDSEFESFYVRPTNGMGCDDLVRKAHGCQYFSFPGYTFAYFREFNITTYENEVDTITLGKWSHLKAEINDDKGVFYVDDVKVLEVNGFKHGKDARGSVGVYVDTGTDAYIKNYQVTCTD